MPKGLTPAGPLLQDGDFFEGARQGRCGRRRQFAQTAKVENAAPSKLAQRCILAADFQSLIAGPAQAAWSGGLLTAAVAT